MMTTAVDEGSTFHAGQHVYVTGGGHGRARYYVLAYLERYGGIRGFLGFDLIIYDNHGKFITSLVVSGLSTAS